jgi:hypothetical protein
MIWKKRTFQFAKEVRIFICVLKKTTTRMRTQKIVSFIAGPGQRLLALERSNLILLNCYYFERLPQSSLLRNNAALLFSAQSQQLKSQSILSFEIY